MKFTMKENQPEENNAPRNRHLFYIWHNTLLDIVVSLREQYCVLPSGKQRGIYITMINKLSAVLSSSSKLPCASLVPNALCGRLNPADSRDARAFGISACSHIQVHSSSNGGDNK